MITYKLINNHKGELACIGRSDGWFIPMHPDNTDYQQYLKWLSEGNTPTPADEGAE
jgi:hypothetical protein